MAIEISIDPGELDEAMRRLAEEYIAKLEIKCTGSKQPAKELSGGINRWNFKMDTPRYLYNKGELYNLSIRRGTLTEEER